jgi:hypothetical protein
MEAFTACNVYGSMQALVPLSACLRNPAWESPAREIPTGERHTWESRAWEGVAFLAGKFGPMENSEFVEALAGNSKSGEALTLT